MEQRGRKNLTKIAVFTLGLIGSIFAALAVFPQMASLSYFSSSAGAPNLSSATFPAMFLVGGAFSIEAPSFSVLCFGVAVGYGFFHEYSTSMNIMTIVAIVLLVLSIVNARISNAPDHKEQADKE